jgi:hypothetical protein
MSLLKKATAPFPAHYGFSYEHSLARNFKNYFESLTRCIQMVYCKFYKPRNKHAYIFNEPFLAPFDLHLVHTILNTQCLWSLQKRFCRYWHMYLKLCGGFERASSISDSFSTCICWDLAMDLHSSAYHAFESLLNSLNAIHLYLLWYLTPCTSIL